MHHSDRLAERFEDHRSHLRAVAYRMLGSTSEADDAVQEAWIRASNADTAMVENVGGWLTTVVSRICLDMLRSRTSRREEPMVEAALEPIPTHAEGHDPEHQAILADSVGGAMLVVLDTLSPAERIAFVLHDMFAVSFEEIAPILDRSPVATRQLASRARRRVRGASDVSGAEIDRRREVVTAFLAAAREGDLSSLVILLDPEAVVRPDAATLAIRADWHARGATDVAKTFVGRARGAHLALINGLPGVVWTPGGAPRGAMLFSFAGDRIAAIDMVAEPERLAGLEIVVL